MAAIVIKNAQDAEFRLEHRDGDDGITIAGRDLRAYATPGYDTSTASWIRSTLTGGAIIERGDNARGTYVKFADGTMICTTTATFAPMAVSTQQDITITFPASFAAAKLDSVVYVARNTSAGDKKAIGLLNYNGIWYDNIEQESFKLYTYSYHQALGDSVYMSILLVGRWK